LFPPGLAIRRNPTSPTAFTGATRYRPMAIDLFSRSPDHVLVFRQARDPFICMLAFGSDPHTDTLLLPSSLIRWRRGFEDAILDSPTTLSTTRRRSGQSHFLGTTGYFLAGVTEHHLSLAGQMAGAWQRLRLSLLGWSWRHHRSCIRLYPVSEETGSCQTIGTEERS